MKTALNDALLFFLSEYLTRIDSELYLKQIVLHKKPAQFRKYTFAESDHFTSYPKEERHFRIKKRHKSTGSEDQLTDHTNLFFLTMNKTARDTTIGKLLQNIPNQNKLNQYVLNNFNENLFEYDNYQETIEYFRETIKIFDYNRILNSLVSEPFVQQCLTTSFKSDQEDESDIDENETHYNLTDVMQNNQRRSNSLDQCKF